MATLEKRPSIILGLPDEVVVTIFGQLDAKTLLMVVPSVTK